MLIVLMLDLLLQDRVSSDASCGGLVVAWLSGTRGFPDKFNGG